MTETAIFSLITQGGPAAMAALCLFLYLRESAKRDKSEDKLEKMTERCLQALHNVDTALTNQAASTESMRGTLNTAIAILSIRVREKANDE